MVMGPVLGLLIPAGVLALNRNPPIGGFHVWLADHIRLGGIFAA